MKTASSTFTSTSAAKTTHFKTEQTKHKSTSTATQSMDQVYAANPAANSKRPTAQSSSDAKKVANAQEQLLRAHLSQKNQKPAKEGFTFDSATKSFTFNGTGGDDKYRVTQGNDKSITVTN